MPITPAKRVARLIGWILVALGAVLILIGAIYVLSISSDDEAQEPVEVTGSSAFTAP